MVRKTSRLTPNTTSVEEILLNRIANNEATSAAFNNTGAQSSTGVRRASTTTERTTTKKTMASTTRAALMRTGSSTDAGAISSTPLPESADTGLDRLQQMANEIEELNRRLYSIAADADNASTSRRKGQSDQRTSLTRDDERSFHQQQIEKYLDHTMQEIFDAHGGNLKNNIDKPSSTTAFGANSKRGVHMTHSVRQVRSTVRRLDRVFYDVASGDKQREIAATKIAAMCRGFLVRRRYLKFRTALSQWRTRKCVLFLMYTQQFSAREEFINSQIAAMHEHRTQSLLRRVIAAIRDVVLMNLPMKMHRLEETENRFKRIQHALLRMVITAWKTMSLGPRSRKKVAANSKARHLAARQRLEAMERFDVITTEMVHEEFLKDNIRLTRSRHPTHVLRMYFRLLVTEEYLPMTEKREIAIAHARKKMLKKVFIEGWLPVFRASQVDKAIAKVTERRTLDRFDKHFNMREIDGHFRRTCLRKHIRAWAKYGQVIRRVRKLFEENTKETMVTLLKRWNVRAQYQHALREKTVEEWKAYGRRIYQTPFRCWYVYASHKKANRVAKESICVAYERRQRRHTKYNFFRIWKHQVLFGNVEGIHSRIHLLRSLEDQKRMCLGLEANAKLYRENIAALQASIAQMEDKLAEKQVELAELHDSTQVLRFGIHTAEQSIARVQGTLEAVRYIHPGTVNRIERMYNDNPLLSKDLKDVIALHAAKRKELLDQIDLDNTALEVHNSSKFNNDLSQEDQLLLHRVKWVLSRMDLKTYNLGNNDIEAETVPMAVVHQLCALFEFIRTGLTDGLAAESSPTFQNDHEAFTMGLQIKRNDGGEVIHRNDLIQANDQWHGFLQALTLKFVPERMLCVKERLLRRAAAMEEEIAEIKANPHMYNIYRYAERSSEKVAIVD